ncbi:MAG: hypothetical protein Q9227_009242 [Pyrenula ochraceoflavens]
MVKWNRLFSDSRRDVERHSHRVREEMRRLLPSNQHDLPPSPFPAKEVTKVALRLKYQVEQVIPCELDQGIITKANSQVITRKVIQTAREAGGSGYKACVVFCLLVCKRWFKRQALLELWDADLHATEEDQSYLLEEVLLRRYSIVCDGEETEPANVIERAVDLHALRVIGSSGYQKCVKYLWKGWLHQDDEDPGRFVEYKEKANPEYWAHFVPDRMRAPVYQNSVQIFFSLLYLALYTGAVNTVNADGDLDIVEGILYIMTAGFICDEVSKFWKVGRYYFGFWNAFNSVLYAFLCISFVLRLVALGHSSDIYDSERVRFNKLSYNFFAFSAPMFWMRLFLYLDTFRFFGAMLVILKVMMKESLIFFALLIVVVIGFLQAFIGLDSIDNNQKITVQIIQAMANALMQSPEFEGFDNFAPPFGIILYYLFTFVVMVLLLNILIALYNSAYEDISGNSDDEYMALFSQKTMQFVRAPDENVFIPPFNLIEIFCLILPFEWWMERKSYELLNNYVMGVIYSPLLLIIASLESREARHIRWNRGRNEEDDDTIEEWEQLEGEIDFEGEGWDKKVESTKPDVKVDATLFEVRELKEQLEDLKRMVRAVSEQPDGANGK